MTTAKARTPDSGRMGLATHLRKHDHWTFIVALVLVALNVRLEDRRLSAVALGFMLAALGYDAYEVLAKREPPS